MIGCIGHYRVGAVGSYANEAAFIAHSQNGMHGIYLLVAFYVAFNGRRRGLHYFLEEAVNLLIGAACKQQQGGHGEPQVL